MTVMTGLPLAAEWRSFRQRLLDYVRRRVEQPADAEDLVQEILIRASERLPGLRSQDRLVPWLHALTRNALVDYYRARGREPGTLPLEAGAEFAAEEPSEAETARGQMAACVRPVLSVLPPIYREAVERIDLNGERQVDVAREMELGISAFKSRVQRGRALLQDAFTACCEFERDAAGRVVGYTPRGPRCHYQEPAPVPLSRAAVRNLPPSHTDDSIASPGADTT
jgi:RNA polymerase sigma-70 factor, ECF subfamily